MRDEINFKKKKKITLSLSFSLSSHDFPPERTSKWEEIKVALLRAGFNCPALSTNL